MLLLVRHLLLEAMPFATSSVLACRDAEGESVPRGMPSSPGKLCEEGEEHLAFRLWLEDTEPKELYFSRSGSEV